MRGLVISNDGDDRLVVDSRGWVLYTRSILDRRARRVDTWAGTRIPFVGTEIASRVEHRSIDEFDHLRIFAFWDRVDESGGSDARYAVVMEKPVDESKLDQLHYPRDENGVFLVIAKGLEQAHEVADRASEFLGMRLLVPVRFRRAAGLR